MIAITDPLERKPIRDIINKLPDDKKQYFIQFIAEYIGHKKLSSSLKRKYELFKDILVNNENSYISLFTEYNSSNNQYRKADIRHGLGSGKKLKTTYAARPKAVNINSCFTVTYWIAKGLSTEEAKKKVSELQSKNAKKKHHKFKSNRLSYKEYLPNCIEYWIARGYDLNESEILRKQISIKSELSYANYIKKYGFDIGTAKLKALHEKRKATLIERFGTTVLNGKCSKESLKFFIPLYKSIRKLGVNKNDIFWGIRGSKEFAHHYNGMNFFYDFTIQSLKITIEYNGAFWHARPETEWKGFGSKEENLAYNHIKENTIKQYGHDLYIVWSDEDLELKRNTITQNIKEKYYATA